MRSKTKESSMKKKPKPLLASQIVKALNKHLSKPTEAQKIMQESAKRLSKEILKAGIGEPVKIKEFTPLGNVPTEPSFFTQIVQAKHKAQKYADKLAEEKRQAGEWVWKPKKRIPTRFNAKKLKEKHSSLWTSIARQVAFDMVNQKQIINSDRDRTCCPIGHLSLRFTETVSENAAFTAIVEMIKRGLL